MSTETETNPVADQNADAAPAPVVDENNALADQNADPAPANDDGTDDTTKLSDEGAKPVEKAVPLQEHIAQRKKRQEAEKEAAYLRGQLEALTKQTAPPVTTAPIDELQKPPKSEDFETWEEYIAADREYTIKVAEQRILAKSQQQRIAQQREYQQTAFQQKLNKAAETSEAVAAVIADRTFPINTHMANILQLSDNAVEVIEWLHDHKAESAKIAQMHPMLAAKELGMIEARLKIEARPEPVKRVSQAPAPIKTVSTSSTPKEFDPETAPMEEYYKRRTAELLKR